MIRALEVLNSGGQLSISRLPPEPPSHRTNGNNQNVYQAPHQHNGQPVYDTYMAQPKQETLYEEYQQSSLSDHYDMRGHEERMYESRGQQIQHVHSSPVLSPPSQPPPPPPLGPPPPPPGPRRAPPTHLPASP